MQTDWKNRQSSNALSEWQKSALLYDYKASMHFGAEIIANALDSKFL